MDGDMFDELPEDWDAERLLDPYEDELEPDYDPVHRFETDTAEYLLPVSTHDREARYAPEVHEEIDAVVLETGRHRYEDMDPEFLHGYDDYGAHHLRPLLEDSIEHDNPIYYVDLPSSFPDNDWISIADQAGRWAVPALGGMMGAAARHPEALVLTAPAFFAGLGGFLQEKGAEPLAAYAHLLGNMATPAGLRSAVTARKVEEDVAPELGGDGGKPTLLLQYGRNHHDVVPYMRAPRLRDGVIAAHRLTAYGSHDGSYVRKIGELRFGEGDETFVDPESGEETLYSHAVREAGGADGDTTGS